MHATKVTLLLLLTLAVMRLASWFAGWLLRRFTKMKRFTIAAAANAIALSVFACFLVTQRTPDELVDLSALTFGIVVYALYTVVDLKWTPWAKEVVP